MKAQTRPIFDPARLELLKPYQDENGRSLDLAIAESFLATTPAAVDKLKVSALTSDGKTFQRQAHTLKSTCAAVGADDLAFQFEQMEAKSEKPERLLEQIRHAEENLEALRPLLQNYIRAAGWRKHG